jgi:hypothetical protein
MQLSVFNILYILGAWQKLYVVCYLRLLSFGDYAVLTDKQVLVFQRSIVPLAVGSNSERIALYGLIHHKHGGTVFF